MPGRSERAPLFDGLAIVASFLCLIHCLVLPVLIFMLPTLGAILAIPESFHVWMIAFALPSSMLALWVGFRRHHSLMPAAIVSPGLLLLAGGVLLAQSEWLETALTVCGALVLSTGHALNLLRPRLVMGASA